MIAALVAALRIVSLDQCADQYALALADRSEIAALSTRATADDAWLKHQARGLPQTRASLEAVIAHRPSLVLRQWGGGPRLDQALARLHVPVVTIGEAHDFDGVRRNVRQTAQALGHPGRGEALVRRMDEQLTAARGGGRGRWALYLTDGAYTAGRGTLIDAILTAAGFTNASDRAGYSPAPVERVLLSPPDLIVHGRFEAAGHGRWSPVRGAALAGLARSTPQVELPGALLGCPAWFAGDAVARLAAGRR